APLLIVGEGRVLFANVAVALAIQFNRFVNDNFLSTLDAALSIIPSVSAPTGVVFAEAPWIAEPTLAASVTSAPSSTLRTVLASEADIVPASPEAFLPTNVEAPIVTGVGVLSVTAMSIVCAL